MDHQKTDEYKFPYKGDSEVCGFKYVEDDFEFGRVFSNTSVNTEQGFSNHIDGEINDAIKRLSYLQDLRTQFNKIKSQHQENRSVTEKRMVG